MPFAAKKPCAGGCGVLVDRGYCSGCKSKGKGKEKRPTAARRGYGAKWQKASAAWLKRHPIAVDIYKTHGGQERPAKVVDHIIPHKGDMTLFWDPSNWQGLTREDHSRKTATEDGGFGRRGIGGQISGDLPG